MTSYIFLANMEIRRYAVGGELGVLSGVFYRRNNRHRRLIGGYEMRIEDTAGNVTYTIPYCECGLTGGCEKCQPMKLAMQHRIFDGEMFVFPEPHEERFLAPDLVEFYRKKGY